MNYSCGAARDPYIGKIERVCNYVKWLVGHLRELIFIRCSLFDGREMNDSRGAARDLYIVKLKECETMLKG